MKILALESSALTASAAICEESRLLGEITLNNGNTHSETLLPMVESLLHFHGLQVSDIDLFAVSIGPGSFTGIRIGAATVKGLAFGSGKPCIGVSTLAALAYNVPVPGGLVCPVMNARRGQVYTALFRCRDGKPERLTPDAALSLEELDEQLRAYDEPVFLTGDGYTLAAGTLQHPIGTLPDRLRYQSAASVAYAAWDAYQSGVQTAETDLKPIYLRPCQAERERAERERTHQNSN